MNSSTNLSVNSTGGLLEIGGRATAEEYMDFLSTVQYFNALDEPNNAYQERSITVTISEDDDQSSESYILVNLISVNDPAQFNFAERTITFDESARMPINLFEDSNTIEDPDKDGGTLTYATLSLQPIIHEGDIIMVTDNEGLVVDGNETYINVSGVANLEIYERVLKSVTFVNTFLDPNPDELREVLINTYDGKDDSDGPTIFINISAFDDPPHCFFNDDLVSKIYVHLLPSALLL